MVQPFIKHNKLVLIFFNKTRNHARDACGKDNCHASKELSKSLGGQIGRGDGLSEKTESAHMVTYEMNHENCRKALRALSATA